jgi:hypothetical protein
LRYGPAAGNAAGLWSNAMTLTDFRPGDRVRIARVRFPNRAAYVGMVGSVVRTVRSRAVVKVLLDGPHPEYPGSKHLDWEADPANLEKLTA